MVKSVSVVNVNEEETQATTNEEPKVEQVEEVKEEPPIQNNVIDEENNIDEQNSEEIKEEPREEKPKNILKTKQIREDRVICPDCKSNLSVRNFKYAHVCKGPKELRPKKEPDPNKVVRRKIMHPEQAKEFENNVYEKVKDNIPKVDEQEIERRVEERLKNI